MGLPLVRDIMMVASVSNDLVIDNICINDVQSNCKETKI